MSIGKLEPVELRDLWVHEAYGFTKWLEDNVDVLSGQIGIELSILDRETPVGPFSVDLVAETSGGSLVIIENQLEPTNHDHLGKVLTYLTNMDAKIAIWITSNPRAEHIRAIAWLNESTAADFYLVRLDAYRIGDSKPAPLFTVIVEPSAETRAIGTEKKALAERHQLRMEFWRQLLERAEHKGVTTHSNVSAGPSTSLSAGAGKAGLRLSYVVWLRDQTAVELYINSPDVDKNKAHFDLLREHRLAIDEAFGERLSWEWMNDNRASRIRHVLHRGGLENDQSDWPAIQDAMIDAMDRLSRTLRPYLTGLK